MSDLPEAGNLVLRRCGGLVPSRPDIPQYHYTRQLTIPVRRSDTRFSSLEGAQLSNTKGSDNNSQTTFDSRIPIGGVRCVQLIGITDPFNIWVLLNIIKLLYQLFYPSHRALLPIFPQLLRTHELEVVISRYTLYVLDSTLLQPLNDIGRKRD